ncbi:MAG: trigger factor [Gammaproteobacteria bacterium]|nr:MAG: trigger factor [Gammaproteobacteria bacterium]
MKTSLETLDGLKRSLTVKLPAETFKQKTDAVLQKMATQVTIDGFRKGKVPLTILRKQFGDNATSDAVNDIVNETLFDALTEVNVTPAARPTISKIDSKDEKEFTYTVEFEVYPEIEIADFSKLKIEQTEVKITKADEERTLEGLITQSTEYKSVKRKSQDGDQVTIDFEGIMDGKVFDGGKATDFQLVLGKGSMIKGFEDGLTDVAAGKSISLDLTFPKDYHAPQLAGKKVTFEISVTDVSSPKAPKLDNKFAEKFGEKDMDALKKSMKEQMRVEVDGRIAEENKNAVFDALLAVNDFTVPQGSVDSEAQNLLQEMQERMQQQGMQPQDGLEASAFNTEATRRVKLGLLINAIASNHNLTASKEQLDAKLVEMSQMYGENAQQMIDYYNEDQTRLTHVELLVVEKMVQDAVLDKATVVLKNKKFQEVTKQT